MRLAPLALAPAALAVLSCHRVPATLPETEPEPSGRSVFGESQKSTHESPLFEPITSEAISLYTCWFERPYEYMFAYAGQPLVVDGRSYGMLMAGTAGILYYGAINECAARMTAREVSHYMDLEPISALAGVPVTLEKPGLPFSSVNPAFIEWARARLLPAADQSIDGVSVQLTYDRVFSRYFHLLGESLFFLFESTSIDSETYAYMQAITTQGAQGMEWLDRRYTGIPGHGGQWDGTTLTAPMAAGFWLRRQLDGSLPACWHGLRDVYEHYDRAWLDDLRTRYPNAAAALAQIPDTATP